MPNIRETADAAASTATTYTLGVGQTAQGTATTQSDHDWYRVNLVAGQTYTFSMIGTGVTNDLDDTYLQLHNSAGTVIATDDDSGPGLSSALTFTASTSGTYYIDAGAYSGASGSNSVSGQYGLSMTTGTMAHFDEMMSAAAILAPDLTWGTARGQAANVTWAVRATFTNSTDASGNAAPFSQLTASEIATVGSVMSYFSDAAGITFTQVNPGGTSDSATMLISNYTSNTDGAGAYAMYPGSTAAASESGDVRLNTTSVNTSSQPTGSYSFFAIMHEMGHAIGLSHPGDYNAAPGVSITYANFAQFQQDTHQYTVMSYFDEENTTTSYGSYPDTLMLHDILALQQLYGANMSARTGNTIYGFGSNAGAVYDFSQNTDPVMCIWDAGGTDTLNASGFSQAQRINLTAGAFSSIGGFTNNVSIAFGAVIENATGGSGDDVIIGNAGANVLNGMSGNDTLQGGLGTDTMQGGLGSDTYFVDRASDIVIEVAGEGSDRIIASGTYTLAAGAAVELLQTINQAATTIINFVGNEFAQSLVGNAAGNILNGMGGFDILRGLAGNDTYYVDAYGDQIQEVAGQGTLDRVLTSTTFGLAADDDIEYLGTTNEAGTTAINMVGNALNQILVGNAGINVLNGGAGIDDMRGLGGNDFYYVDNALDTIQEAAGQGTLDRVLSTVSFTLAADDNIEYLATTNEACTGAINLTGNALAQTIVGNAGSNVVAGGLGNDILRGLGGDDYFVFNTAPSAGNVDTLSDFSAADTILLENAIFTGLTGLGALSAAQFVANTSGTATTASQHIIYETDTGNLYYDSNGNTAGGSVLFAHLNAGLVLTSTDFYIV